MEFHDAIAARTLYGEARGESDLGRLAVAHVIRNRLKTLHWGSTPAAVCLAPAQFSCWLTSDPNRRKMLELDEADESLQQCADAWWLSESGKDPTHGATHYQVTGTDARWSEGQTPSVVIGHHSFYNTVK